MSEMPVLYGAGYSVYVRIARMCLEEKGVHYRLHPVDIFSEKGPPVWYLGKHPFGRIPAFKHGDLRLYETSAIARYIDEAFEGPPLQPAGIVQRARCNQLISIADNYAYPQMVWGVYVERVSKPKKGTSTDENRLASAVRSAASCLGAMSRLMGTGPWLVGDQLTLADLYAAAMFHYFMMAPEAESLIDPFDNLKQWWSRASCRPSMIKTKST